MNRKQKRARFEALGGRKGVSERILEIAGEIISLGSYKRAVIGAGQIRVLAEICEADSYWDEKMSIGRGYEERICNGAHKVTFDVYGIATQIPLIEVKEEP